MKNKIFASADGYASDVLPKSDYGYDIVPPAPPEGCFYVYDPKTGALVGMECKKEYDTPIDVILTPTFETPKLEPIKEPVKDVPVDNFVFGATDDTSGFPNWDSLNCDELLKNIQQLKETMTMIRLASPNVYDKNLEYAQSLYEKKCGKSAPVDETPVDIKPTDVTPTGGGTGVTPEPLPPVPAKEPFKFSWWWLVAAGVGLYLLSSKKNG